jgi:hypothetical protein
MKPTIKEMDCSSFDLATWSPMSESDVAFLLELEIGEGDDERRDVSAALERRLRSDRRADKSSR